MKVKNDECQIITFFQFVQYAQNHLILVYAKKNNQKIWQIVRCM